MVSALGPLVRCAAQAQGCAVAQPCAPVGALVRHVRLTWADGGYAGKLITCAKTRLA